MLFQVAIAFFGFFMMYVLRINFRRGHLKPFEFGTWLAIWFGLIIFALFPGSLRGVADSLRIGRVFDLLSIIAFVILSVVLVSTRLAVLELRRKLEIVVRTEALRQANKPKTRR
jgi:hypothetical protein